MSKIKITTIVKLACAGAVVALTIAMCATPLAPLGICIAVGGTIIFGCDIIESIQSYFEHHDIVQLPDTNHVDNTVTQNSHIGSQSKGITNNEDDATSICSSTDTFYSTHSHDSAISMESREIINTSALGAISDHAD